MIAHLLQGLVVTTGSSRPLPARPASGLQRAANLNPYHLLIQVLRSQTGAGERIASVLAASSVESIWIAWPKNGSHMYGNLTYVGRTIAGFI
jgi:hypothetical protein